MPRTANRTVHGVALVSKIIERAFDPFIFVLSVLLTPVVRSPGQLCLQPISISNESGVSKVVEVRKSLSK